MGRRTAMPAWALCPFHIQPSTFSTGQPASLTIAYATNITELGHAVLTIGGFANEGNARFDRCQERHGGWKVRPRIGGAHDGRYST